MRMSTATIPNSIVYFLDSPYQYAKLFFAYVFVDFILFVYFIALLLLLLAVPVPRQK